MFFWFYLLREIDVLNVLELCVVFVFVFVYVLCMMGLFMVMFVLVVVVMDYLDYLLLLVGFVVGGYGLI